MARPVYRAEGVYVYTGELPRGCQLCMRGSKIVVFVTGLCRENCFYCPVSPHRFNRDVVYVDEEVARRPRDVAQEALRVGAEGAAMTGGEPLERLKRVVSLVRLLKGVFGDDFHVHLYTSGRWLTGSTVRLLEQAGLDELRIHPVEERLWERVRVAVEARREMSVGVEVPVLPDRVEWLRSKLEWLESIGADFVNLNELEVAPHRVESMLARGYRVRGYVVEGSYEAGVALVEWAAENLERLSVHFCPASYKDRVQHTVRLNRKAERVALLYEEPTGRGTLAYIEAECSEARSLVEEGFGVEEGGRCLVKPSAARGLKKGWLVEVYPDSGRRLVSRQPVGSRGGQVARRGEAREAREACSREVA